MEVVTFIEHFPCRRCRYLTWQSLRQGAIRPQGTIDSYVSGRLALSGAFRQVKR